MNRKIFTITLLFSLIVCTTSLVSAQPPYVPPAPLPDIVVRETRICISVTIPTKTFFIDVTEYDPEQVIKNITTEFYEAIDYFCFTIYISNEKPFGMDTPRDATVIQYFTIRISAELVEKVKNVTVVFGVEKATLSEKGVDEGGIALYRYNEETLEKGLTQKIGEDSSFLYFKAEKMKLSYLVVAGLVPAQSQIILMIIIETIIVVVIVTGIFIRHRLSRIARATAS